MYILQILCLVIVIIVVAAAASAVGASYHTGLACLSLYTHTRAMNINMSIYPLWIDVTIAASQLFTK